MVINIIRNNVDWIELVVNQENCFNCIFVRFFGELSVSLPFDSAEQQEACDSTLFPKRSPSPENAVRVFKALIPLLQETRGVCCHGNVIIIVSLSLGADFGVVCTGYVGRDFLRANRFLHVAIVCGWMCMCVSWKAITHEKQTVCVCVCGVCVCYYTSHRGQ